MATALMHVLTSHAGTTHLGGTRSTLETSLIWFEREKKIIHKNMHSYTAQKHLYKPWVGFVKT